MGSIAAAVQPNGLWNIPNPSQPNPGLRGDGSPCRFQLSLPLHLECPLEHDVGDADPEGSRVKSLAELGGGGDEAPLHVDIVRGRGDC